MGCNGFYGDIGADRIVIGNYQKKIKGVKESAGAVVLGSTTYFQGITHAFKVKEIAPNGSTLTLEPTLSSNVENRISRGDVIPDFSFELLSGEETSLNRLLEEKRMLYLNFWATWCGGCHKEINDLKKIHKNYSEQVRIVSLNYNESLQKITPFLEEYQINWLNGYATNEMNQDLMVQGLPRNILVDSTGIILKMNLHPKNLLKRLE